MRKLIFFFAGVFFSFSSIAQLANVSGTVNDRNQNKPIQYAVIALLTPKDSTLYQFTRTDVSGKFTLKNIIPGKYILMTTHPYFADLLDDIEINRDTQLPLITLISKSELLQEVIINTGTPLRIKGDTTIYTADSFKVSANANVEELLRKLPGIQVDKDGKIKAMGETVQKVLVDGEEFFGDDPGMAVKNIRADAVKEVQVFDKKSDESEFTGIDDGKTQKTINLKLKENRKTGYFGKIDVAGGTKQNNESRYNDNLMFGSFKGKRKLSAFLLNGNTGQNSLSWEDEKKYSSVNYSANVDDDGSLNWQYTGSNDDEPRVDPQNGFMTNVNAGLLYSNIWNAKYNLNLSPKYNNQQYLSHQQAFTQTQVGDSVLYNNTDETNNVNRHNFKSNLILDVKMDSMNSLKIIANNNFYHTDSRSVSNSVSTGNTGTLKNSSFRNLQTQNDKNAESGSLLFRHKFHKNRRTLSIGGNWYFLDNQGNDFLKSLNQAYNDGNPSGSQDLNQMKDYHTSTKSLSGKIIYTEPLSKEYSIELAYQLAYNYGFNNQLTYNYTPVSDKYDVLVDSLSNRFKQNIVQNIPSTRINFANKKFKINIGSGFGFTNYDLKDITFNKVYTRNYVNYYPSANITYTYKPNKTIRFNYNGNTTQPTINQLQPLRNNNNYFNQYIGNPDLKPSFTNSFNVSHYNYNFLNDLFTYQNLNISVTNNSISYNRTINVDSGKTTIQPFNTNGNVSLNFYTGIGLKIKKIDTRINLFPQISYNQYADIINNKKNLSKTYSPGFSIGISKRKEKKYDISLSDQFNYNANTTSQNNTKIHYNTNTIYFNGTLYIKKVWSVNTDLQIYSRQKTQQFTSSLNSNQWNARFQRTFKNNEFTAYVSVHDILNQNIGIDRNFSSNTYSQVIYDRLKRYFLIGFTWDFKNKAPKKK